MNIRFKLLDRTFILSTFKTPKYKTSGISSRTEDNKHVLFLDYDHVLYEVLLKDVRTIQKRFCLSNAYVLKTKEEKDHRDKEFGSYHVYILDKLSYYGAMFIMRSCHIDPAVMRSQKGFMDKCFILRWAKKKNDNYPVPKEIIRSNNDVWIKSYSHYLFLKKVFFKELPEGPEGNYDNYTDITFYDYLTGKVKT